MVFYGKTKNNNSKNGSIVQSVTIENIFLINDYEGDPSPSFIWICKNGDNLKRSY
jgi:hypothetical protein